MVAVVAVERWTELDWPGLASERETGWRLIERVDLEVGKSWRLACRWLRYSKV